MRIATGEIEEPKTEDGKNAAAVALGRLGGMQAGLTDRIWEMPELIEMLDQAALVPATQSARDTT